MSFSFPHVSRKYIRANYNSVGLLWGVPVYAFIEYDDVKQELFLENVVE